MTQKIHKLTHWLKRRNPQYIALRMGALLQRYGVGAERAERRTLDCVRFLARYHCSPTFPTPGRVVQHNAAFCRELQRLGAELAIHGYDHIDFHSLSHEEAASQFARAQQAYQESGIQSSGFRCPYLSYSDRLLDTLPQEGYRYSSNKAIWWDVVDTTGAQGEATAIFESLKGFYDAAAAGDTVAVPHVHGRVVEIPVSLPDDLQLYDGLQLGEQGLSQAWQEILHQTHRRGELFVLLFHPESFYYCAEAFRHVLQQAQQLAPPVWRATLHEVGEWWWEKADFRADVATAAEPDTLQISFTCSPRATILVRNLTVREPAHPWHGAYQVLEGQHCTVAATPRPLLGVLPDVPAETVTFLREQGYLVEHGEMAAQCGLCLDAATLAGLTSQVALINHIEASTAPLVRFWRWPANHRSALAITGDLDALSLQDYAARVLPWS